MLEKRILGIDFGEKRIGLAISDLLGMTAQPLDLLVRSNTKQDLATLQALVEEYDVEKIVIGLPLNMDGSEGFMVEAVRAFCDQLKTVIDLPIIELDERLTSFQAQRALNQSGGKGRNKKGKDKRKNLDTLSAQIILQTHLDQNPD